jgi:hypothetical protein
VPSANQGGLDNLSMCQFGVDPDDLTVHELIADGMLLEPAIDLFNGISGLLLSTT